jgi:NTP pyrophosphatase (non-canonical NTP hydrolase)
MNLIEYRVEAPKTLNDKGFELNLCHAALGIITEVEEYFQAADNGNAPNMEEELGDLAWFANLGAVALGITLNENDIEEQSEAIMAKSVVEFADMVKSIAIYGKAANLQRAEELLMQIFGFIKKESNDFNLCLKSNIVKLQFKRYKKDGIYNPLENFNRDVTDGVNAVLEVFGKEYFSEE